MACIYEYKGHKFNSELELDQFLLENNDFLTKYGDIVFSRSSIHNHVIDVLNQAKEDARNLREQYFKEKSYFDGESEEEFKPPYIGVNRFLSGLRNSEGQLLFPEFIEENYWEDRKAKWKINEFNDDEKELFFNGQQTQAILESDAQYYIDLMKNKWENQAKIGTELHKILQVFFSEIKTGRNAGKIMGTLSDDFIINTQLNNLDSNLVNDKAIRDTLKIARSLHQQIIDKFGDNCTFFPEFTISNKVSHEIEGKGDTILGIIDLLVVDDKGNCHVIDYKASPKTFDKYNSAKQLTYTYQISVYNRILQRYGINVDDSEMLVVPLHMKNFRKEGDKFVYDGVEPIKNEQVNENGETIAPILWESIKNRVETSFNIQKNLQEFLPTIFLNTATTEDALQEVQRVMSEWFPEYSSDKQHFSEEDIKQELEKAKAFTPNENGQLVYQLGKKQFVANNETELLEKVKEYREFIFSYKASTTKNIINNLKEGINNEDPDISLPSISKGQTGVNPNWLRDKLAKYCNHNYQIIDNATAEQFGIIIIQNKITGQIDFIRISPNNLVIQKHFNKRNILSGTFESDLAQQSKANSLMLESRVGNIELMEEMLIINSLQGLFNNESTVGSIEVINPFEGHGVTASNEELLYCWNTLNKFVSVQNNNFSSGKIRLASKYQLAYNTFKNIMSLGLNKNWGGEFKKYKMFESSLSMLDAGMDENIESKIQALEELRLNLEKNWDFSAITTEQSQLNHKNVTLYNQVLIALAELRGVNFRQQIEQNDSWLESILFNKKGISGLNVDNPGNLNSQTLNLLTNLVTAAYQNVRADMQEPRAKVRELVKKLKEAKSFGSLQEYTFGNQANLYKDMIRINSDGDLLFKSPDEVYTQAEKDFLNYILDVINKNRFPFKTKQQLEQMKQSKDIFYYRVPLAIGDLQSRASVDGLLEAFKDRLRSFNPKVLLERSKDRLEGINRVEENTEESRQKRRASELFQMGVIFDKGEKSDRVDYINLKGVDYFEHNLENLVLKHIFQYSMKQNIDKIFPMMKAAAAHLSMQGANQNTTFDNDINYLKNYIVNKIKNESIVDAKYEYANELIGEIKQAASFMSLAFSPVQSIYQSLQGLWNDIRLIVQKPDIMERNGKSAFTFKNVFESFKSAYSDLFHFSDSPTLNSLINELYGLNDMDMNQYIDRLKSDKHGFFNFNRFAMMFSSRPDYYNRLTIFGAQMRADGCYKAHKIVNGRLVYDMKLDERFNALYDPSNPKHNEQFGLYYAMAKQFVNEHAKNPDGSDFVLDMKKLPPLPRAYTTLQAESYKSLADDIYGYYTHEKKSLMHSMLLGGMFMQFKTFWSGKKNQYAGKGGVKLRGKFIQAERDGKPLYYKVKDDGTVTDEITEEVTNVPVYIWKGQWQEGIILTLNEIASLNPKDFKDNLMDHLYNEDPILRNVYRSNLKQLLFDLTSWIFGGVILAAIMGDWLKELKEDIKDSKDFMDGVVLASANILVMSVKNSFLDFNITNSFIEPTTTWTPFSLEWATRTLKNIYNTALGDRDFWDGVVNSSSALKQIKPGLDIIKPE